MRHKIHNVVCREIWRALCMCVRMLSWKKKSLLWRVTLKSFITKSFPLLLPLSGCKRLNIMKRKRQLIPQTVAPESGQFVICVWLPGDVSVAGLGGWTLSRQRPFNIACQQLWWITAINCYQRKHGSVDGEILITFFAKGTKNSVSIWAGALLSS